MRSDHESFECVDAEVYRRAGLTREGGREMRDDSGDEYYRKVHNEVFNKIFPKEENDAREAYTNDLIERLYKVLKAILAERASTVEGLKIQTRAAVLAASDNWVDFDEEYEHTKHESISWKRCVPSSIWMPEPLPRPGARRVTGPSRKLVIRSPVDLDFSFPNSSLAPAPAGFFLVSTNEQKSGPSL
jgi:hypothetical protein